VSLDRERFEAAPTFEQYLDDVERNRDLWHGVYERAEVPRDLLAAARAMGEIQSWVLSEGLAMPSPERY
jgi:hypothetical protein